jgi:acetylornithine aminotransferase/acetylornithine/N-succinyldiaminopimelate aminotransferase
MHGTTFGGNPFACAVAIAAIDTIQRDNLLAHNTELGAYFLAQLRTLAAKHSSIKEARGLGLMIGLEFHSADLAKSLQETMMNTHHILLNRTHDTVLRFLPPYLITHEHVDQTIAALDTLLTQHSTPELQTAEATAK